jgi:NAD(P)-dependent dehydrogenase (short-subunit alcohol dehydrogenase family)
VGAIVVTNAFLPLIEKGTQKKVINISSAAGDSEFVEKSGYTTAVPYGISKAALNLVNTKYAVEFRGKGYTFLAISPGLVDTRAICKSLLPKTPRMRLANVLLLIGTVEEEASRDAMIRTLKASDPDWCGVPLLPSQAVDLVLGVIDRATPEDSGRFVSQYGDRRWL